MSKADAAILYRWAMEGLKAQQKNGNWPMTIRELAKVWGVKENPTGYRLRLLVKAGYVETHPYGTSGRFQYRFIGFG